MSYGLTGLFCIVLGEFFFKNVRGGVHIPFLGQGYQKKEKAILFFIVSIFFVGFISEKLQPYLYNIIQNDKGVTILAVLFFFALFNYLCYN